MYGNGGETLPLVPVVKLPEGKTVDSAGRARPAAQDRGHREEDRARLAGGGLRLDRRPGVRLRGRPHRVRVRVHPAQRRPVRRQHRGDARAARRAGRGHGGGRPGAPDRLRRPVRLLGRGRRRARRAAGGGAGRRGRAGGAGVRVRLRAGLRAAGHGHLLDPGLVPAAVRADGDHRGVADRAVPGGAGGPGHLDRLRAAGGGALARGARARQGGRRRRGRRDDHGRPRRGVLGHHRGRRPAGADRAAAAVPAQHGLRRDDHPAGGHAGRDHAAAGGAGHDRPAARPAAHPPQRPQRALLAGLGRGHRAPPRASPPRSPWPSWSRS